jgi:predicted amidohydrolase
MKFAACQVPYVSNDLDRAVSLLKAHSADAERQEADLVCFPECFLQGYHVTESHVKETAIEIASGEFESLLEKLSDVAPIIVVGLIERDTDRFYNTAIAVKCGALIARYRKVHLFGGERTIFDSGSAHSVFDVENTTIGINICADLNSSESVRAAAVAGAKVLVCPCNNMMRRESAEEGKWRHNEIRSTRASESQIWLISSDVTGELNGRISYGPTAVIDPQGHVVEQVPLMKTGMVVADIA